MDHSGLTIFVWNIYCYRVCGISFRRFENACDYEGQVASSKAERIHNLIVCKYVPKEDYDMDDEIMNLINSFL